MEIAAQPSAGKSASKGLTGAKDEWVKDTLGKDPKTYKSTDVKADGSVKPQTAAAASAAAPAATAPAATPAAKTDKGPVDKLKSFVLDHVEVKITPSGDKDDPHYDIETTIHFEAGKDAGASDDGPKVGELETEAKSDMKNGASAFGKASRTYKHTLSADQAQSYVDIVKNKGKGGKLLEHGVMEAGFRDGWAVAKQVADGVTGGAMQAGDERTTTVEGGVNAQVGGHKQIGMVEASASVRGAAKHKVTIKEAMLADGSSQFTATVEDDIEAAEKAALGVAKGGIKLGAHGTKLDEHGAGKDIVFVVPKDSKDFDALRKAVMAVRTMGDLTALDKQHHGLLDSTTDRTHSGKGNDFGIGGSAEVGEGDKKKNISADFTIMDKGTKDTSRTRDRDGNTTHSTADAAARTGATLGIQGHKVGFDETNAVATEVDKTGAAQGSLGHSGRETDLGKTAHNLYDAVKKDGLKALKDPAKQLAESESSDGLAFDDKQFMAICEAAKNESKWQGMVGGHLQKEWIAVGQKIRATMEVKGGKIVNIDKHMAASAIADWDNSDQGGRDRNSVFERIVRPYGGAGEGKGSVFPDGTDKLKPVWDKMVIKDPVAPAKALIADGKLKQAAEALEDAKTALDGLHADMKKQEDAWAEHTIQYSEMLQHLGKRSAEITACMHEMKQGNAAPEAGKPAEPEGLSTYSDNKETMKGHYDRIFAKLNAIKAIVTKHRFDNLDQNLKDIKAIDDLLPNWQRMWDETYKLHQKLAPTQHLDEAALKALHPKGAHDFRDEVFKQVQGGY